MAVNLDIKIAEKKWEDKTILNIFIDDYLESLGQAIR